MTGPRYPDSWCCGGCVFLGPYDFNGESMDLYWCKWTIYASTISGGLKAWYPSGETCQDVGLHWAAVAYDLAKARGLAL